MKAVRGGVGREGCRDARVSLKIIGESLQVGDYSIRFVATALSRHEVSEASLPFVIRPELLRIVDSLDIVVTYFDLNARSQNAHIDDAVLKSDSDVWFCHVFQQPIMADKG